MNKMKLAAAVLAVGALLLTSCSGSSDKTATPGSAGNGEKAKVVSVVNGPLGDSSFFDDAERGMQKLKGNGHQTQTIQSELNNPAQWKANVESVSTGKWDLVVVGTSQMVDILKETAAKYPKQKYIIYDDFVEQPNVASIRYKQNEGSFLAGVLAGLATTDTKTFPKSKGSKIIGMVGGLDIPIINDFLAGFKKGAESVDPQIQVKVSYVGNFADSNKGYDQAKLMYDQGADVVFQVAGGAGLGVLKAAKDADRYAIGVDSNQNALQQGHVLASMLKNIGDSIVMATDAYDKGELGFGKLTSYGLANKGVSLTYENNGDIVPKSIQDKVQEFADKVASGEITVPTTLK